jgi:hypothetical protein
MPFTPKRPARWRGSFLVTCSGASAGSSRSRIRNCPKPRRQCPLASAAPRHPPEHKVRILAQHSEDKRPGPICRHATRRRRVRGGAIRPGNPEREGWSLVGREKGRVHPALRIAGPKASFMRVTPGRENCTGCRTQGALQRIRTTAGRGALKRKVRFARGVHPAMSACIGG